MRWPVASVLVAVALAGCLGAVPDDPAPSNVSSGTPRDVANASRRGLWHGPNASPVDVETPAPEPRLARMNVTAVEPTLGLTSDGTIYVTALPPGDVGFQPVVMASEDGGRSWQRVYERHPTSLDPYTYVDRDTDRVFTVDYTGCHTVSFSDGGTWRTSQVGCGWNTDHQTLFAGPPAHSPTVGYPNVVYLCSIGGGALASFSTAATCSKSLDGGLTWTPTGTPAYTHPPAALRSVAGDRACYGGTGHGEVGPEGTVYLPRAHCGQPHLAISTDEGATWQTVQVAETGVPTADGVVEHEAAVDTDANGTVYYHWVGGDDRPYLAVSTDRGSTWSDPIAIGPPGLEAAALPAVHVGPNGTVAAAYMGSWNASAGDDRWWHGVVTVTRDATASAPTFASAAINDRSDPLVIGSCGPIRCQQEFDFIDVEVGPDGDAWSVFVDGCEGRSCSDLGEGVVGHLPMPRRGKG